ncbi:ABC transporter permease [Microbacterium azadirachtae]|uniref:Putative spermidine/putrescine transport system permease protein n=1 Tax=Microbacterium azadirachtae TaxID=582680 RepID=A0A1I6G6V2_9MICO|nr:ABC transporter permease subunit [Microbacterium azadirachtae]SDL35886.1 putative spermidine/putrescine transport system permease protein [Microbacterium azadirachtae]SEF66618.1 putative spermidine/putrescine transport system permease protein [Microbacterium azadirachtae]SEF67384.1 putative spermidine/putrescine transport system permease protein [Microbacterium azadirachtae]SFR37851.1 putative spermidine/putrescine transport system permease protein [Microbacterium azadirachtae]
MNRVAGKPSPWVARIVILLVGVLFLAPLAAMLEFSFRQQGADGYTFEHWVAIFDPNNSRAHRNLFTGLINSTLLTGLVLVLVLVLFLPTIVLVHLRFPRLERPLDMLTVLPIAIPVIAMVVGFAPIYRVLGAALGSGPWTLVFAYGVQVLPFAYRAIVAELHHMDARARAEAARSLGAGWIMVLVRVITPGLRRSLLTASLLTVAIVFGEFTIAALLNRVNLQTALLQLSLSDAYVATAVSLLSLFVVFLMLVLVGRRRRP